MATLRFIFISTLLFFSIFSIFVYAENTFLPFSARVNLNNREHNGNFTVNIYDTLTGGALIYNETFSDAISGGRARAILGNQNVTLDLVGGRVYYLELFIDQTKNMSFTVNGTSQRRIPFVAPIQIDHNVNITNITVNAREDNSVILRGGIQVDNFFNISRTTSSARTNGTFTILSLLNPALSIYGFNVSGSNSALSTNGSILVNNLFNVTASSGNTEIGGTLDVDGVVTLNSRASPAFSVNSGFNISGANSALSTNGTVSILSLLSPALSIQGFNVSGSNAVLSTNGSILVNNLFNITATSGNTEIGGILDVDGNSVFQNKLYSVGDFNVSGLFNVTASSGALRIGGVLTALNNIIVNNFFNITISDSQIRTNGTLTIRSTDSDDALNVTGGVKMLQNLTVDHNITATNYYGNGAALTGLNSPALNDSEWIFVKEVKIATGQNIDLGNLPRSNVYKVSYFLNMSASTDPLLRINNVSGADTYSLRTITLTANVEQTTATGVALSQNAAVKDMVYGIAYISCDWINSQVFIINQAYSGSGANVKTMISGSVNTCSPISDITILNAGGNSTAILWRHRFFND